MQRLDKNNIKKFKEMKFIFEKSIYAKLFLKIGFKIIFDDIAPKYNRVNT